MASEKVVLDASVLAKWYLDEEYSDRALEIRDAYISGKIRIAAPALLIYEVLNAMRYSGVYSEDELTEIAESINKYGFEIHGFTEPLKEQTVKIALKHDVSIYDATYISLAKTLNTKLYTADDKLISKVAQPNLVKHISTFPSR